MTSWFRFIYAGIFAVAVGEYFEVLRLVDTTDYLTKFDVGELQAQVMSALNGFNDIWAIGYVFFGLHLLVLGYLSLRSEYVPKIWGVILMIAGLSYLIDYFSQFLFPENRLPLSTYFGWGELVFIFWLLIKGGKQAK